jgi:hypothetical protein
MTMQSIKHHKQWLVPAALIDATKQVKGGLYA